MKRLIPINNDETIAKQGFQRVSRNAWIKSKGSNLFGACSYDIWARCEQCFLYSLFENAFTGKFEGKNISVGRCPFCSKQGGNDTTLSVKTAGASGVKIT